MINDPMIIGGYDYMITQGIRPIWRIHSLTSSSLYKK